LVQIVQKQIFGSGIDMGAQFIQRWRFGHQAFKVGVARHVHPCLLVADDVDVDAHRHASARGYFPKRPTNGVRIHKADCASGVFLWVAKPTLFHMQHQQNSNESPA
jgi:hypothetical protein